MVEIGISTDEFANHYPRLYHMAEKDSWESIKTHGLLSTSALLDLFEIHGATRVAIESNHRPESVIIRHPELGSATIRDQKPMRESALLSCLNGCTPREWYRFLNRHVFFWVSEERVRVLLRARAYRKNEHLVLTLDTSALLYAYHKSALLSPINSGSTIYRPVGRGLSTFAPLSRYPFAERKRIRGVANAVAELTVPKAVPDVFEFVTRAEIRKGDDVLRKISVRS
jgi:hypothetical protein